LNDQNKPVYTVTKLEIVDEIKMIVKPTELGGINEMSVVVDLIDTSNEIMEVNVLVYYNLEEYNDFEVFDCVQKNDTVYLLDVHSADNRLSINKNISSFVVMDSINNNASMICIKY
tara:strand:+ start:1883 stop:2230 length:348 start_codon:yes stop_codon:yes gene_type:complete